MNFIIGTRIQKVVIYRLDSIALGILAAYIHRWHPAIWRKSRNISFIIGVVVCYIIIYIHWPPNLFFTKVFRIFIESFCCFLLLPKFESIKKGPKDTGQIFHPYQPDFILHVFAESCRHI